MAAFSVIIVLATSAFFAALDNRYPKRYFSLIREKADEYSLDSAFVAAIVCVESGFNPMAKSGKGARGLMQLMPSTAEWIANKNGIAYSEELLVNAEYAAAYNAGEGNVRKWLNDGGSIEFPETAAYVKKVAAAENVYRERI